MSESVKLTLRRRGRERFGQCVRHGLVAFLAALLLAVPKAPAQQQYQGVCAGVKIVILQELTIERIGFEATLELTNNDGDEPITDFSAELTFENPALSTNEVRNDASALFFVRTPTFEDVNSVGGDGIIGPTRKAVVRWFIIPKISAGGADPAGIRYKVGARLGARLRGVELTQDVLRVVPDDIFVKPEPQLEITYFQPRDVQGDDPFTAPVESPIPFTLGVLVKNSGFGLAKSVKINSQQPKIVENRQNLLLIAQLLGTRVNDSPLQAANLLVNLGDIQPGQARKGVWDMITSLSGTFVEFKASYTHASELGGEETSVIKSLNAYFIAHEVLNDQSGRDRIKDFLADTDNDPDQLPDALYESEGNVLPVNALLNATVTGTAGPLASVRVDLVADREGWGYMRLNDPGQARLPIASVVRNDGKFLNTNNYWTNFRYEPVSNNKLTFLNIFDLVALGTYNYTVTYGAISTDAIAPVTTLHFAGSFTQVGNTYFVTPDTQMYFLSEDESPVSIVYSVTNRPFLPALPFRLTLPGVYDIAFYATDSSGNQESNRTATIVVAGDPPVLASVDLPQQPVFISGDALSVRPVAANLSFLVAPNPMPVAAAIDIFQGVLGWATLSGIPSSPTADRSATLSVGGDNVDYYRYRLDAGAWSSETLVLLPIELAGLADGTHTIAVSGRSQYGAYLADSNAVSATWVVNPSAPATRVSGVPPTPGRQRTATLLVSGNGVTDYRWAITGSGFYRAETSVTNPVVLTALAPGTQTVSVISKIGGVFQLTNNATTVSWVVDPAYGSELSSLARVRSLPLTVTAGSLRNFAWDGRNDAGAYVPEGWYTIRLRVGDPLGQTNFATRIVQVGDLSESISVLADATRGPKNPHARGQWTVWQDQSSGAWQIYAQNFAASPVTVVPVTSGTLAQENPKTDGRYVVWQGRQSSGNWDVYLKNLTDSNPPQALTATPDTDEINPAIDWPWVVWQARSSSDATAPWQLRVRNLVSGATTDVWPSTQDQLDPDVQAGRVVWQDWRDVGPGEIYYKHLETGDQRRLTFNVYGQYHPAIYGPWVVWQDQCNGALDLFAYHLQRSALIQITDTPEDEARPYIEGPWVVCEENSLGPLTGNVRLVHLPTLRSIPLTRSVSPKVRPALAGGRVVWQDAAANLNQILSARLSALQPVFENQNAVAVTEGMVAFQQNAYNLLTLWQTQAGVVEITRYTAFVPQVVSETAQWNNGAPTGTNFPLVAGTFLWVKFDSQRVLDLGNTDTDALNLSVGVNVFSFGRFPNGYSAYPLLRQLGFANARAVRMLDSESGRWVVAEVRAGKLVGHDFPIPNVAVLMVDMAGAVSNFKPQ